MRVYKCILENPGITSKEIMLVTGVQCPSGRISEIRDLGIKIISIGQRKFPGSKPFEMYKIEGEPLTKQEMRIEIKDGVAIRTFQTVNV